MTGYRRFLIAAALALVVAFPGLRQMYAQQTYTQQSTLANDATFQARVQVAMVQAAVAISTESAATVNHTKRIALAGTVLAAPSVWMSRVTLAVVADTSITSASTDAVIAARVSAVWDALANGANCPL
jgi:hypothetical protein